MLQSSFGDTTLSRRYALCVGIGTYTNLLNRNLRYAVADATTIAERLADPQRGNFAARVLTGPTQTTKTAIDEAVEELLSAPDRQAEDLTLLYFSCHGDVDHVDNTFCLLPSNATRQAHEMFEQTTLIGISDLTRWFSRARTHNIIMLLDVCHSGGAGTALQHFKLNLEAGPNFFIIGAARQDQITSQISRLHHGMFTHCLLRAFEQPPTKDGWLTISQIQNFISSDISWFAKDQPIQIQTWSVFVNPHLPLLRNPGYPELCPLPPLWNVPFQRNLFFTGQDDVLSQLASLLQSEQNAVLTQPYAINGLGGIGKTQLALEYAYRHRQDYHAVLWGRADTREALISTFVNIALLLDLPQKDEKDQMVIVEAVKAWLKDRSTWLLILDNADELALVKEFLPPAFRGHLLLTTRAQAMGGLARKLEMEMMQPEIGSLLLLRRSGRLAPQAPLEQAASLEILEAKALAQELGGLPLALDQAGAYMEETQCRLTEYRDLYRLRRADLLKIRGGLVDDHPEPVATTWSLSFQRVKEKNVAAAELLRFCAYLAPDAIPEEILTDRAIEKVLILGQILAYVAGDVFRFNQAIATLQAYSLIVRDPQAKTLTVHRLVQAVLRDNMSPMVQQQWMDRVVDAVEAAYPDLDFANWPALERLLPHAHICTIWIEQARLGTPAAARLLNQTGYYLFDRARYREAKPLLQLALQIREKELGPEHLDVATSLNNLAVLYNQTDKYDQAEPLHERALQIREKVLGPEHPDVATSLSNLALVSLNLSKHQKGKLLLERALQIREKVLGPEHPDVATSLSHLATVYYDQYQPAEAEPLLERALQIREKVLGPKHPAVAVSLTNLGVHYSDQNQYIKAESLYQRAIAIDEQIYGSEHPEVATDINNLANLYSLQGRHEEAKLLYERALQIKEQWFGYEQSETTVSLRNLAMHYYWQGKYAEAKPLMQKACIIGKQVLGPEHPRVVDLVREYDLLCLSEELQPNSDWETRQSQQSNVVEPRQVNLLTRVIQSITIFTKKHHRK